MQCLYSILFWVIRFLLPYCLTDAYVYFVLSVSNLIDFLPAGEKAVLSPFAIHFNIPVLQINLSLFNFSFEMVKTFCLALSFHMSKMNSFNMCSFFI